MKIRIPVFLVTCMFFISCTTEKPALVFKSDSLAISISENGYLHALTDIKTQTDYLAKDTIAPFLSVKINSEIVYPISVTKNNGVLMFQFNDSLEAKVNVEEKASHLSFELTELSKPNNVELIIWGPIPTTIKKTIGETVGVVRGEEFALGLQSLNPKTLGGYPWLENDAMPQFDIFDQEDYSDMSEKNKGYTLYRVEAAKPTSFGSSLQAYCRNRSEARVVANLNHKRYVSPAYDDQGVIGSKIALFGTTVENTLETIGQIEIAENLPHPTIDGEWGKQATGAAAAYLISEFGEASIHEAIAYTKQAGLKYLYHPGPFETWGHFELRKEQFPNGWDGLKKCVELAKDNGIDVGVHTLSNFITTNDPYVTPVPDKRLGEVGTSVLSEKVTASQTDIPIESPQFFNQFKNNSLQTIRIGDELIRYKSVTEEAPFTLSGCQRGAWGTTAAEHKGGEKVAKLIDHAYKVFLSNAELSIEIGKKLADLYNYCGLRQISFDGIEGNKSTGMGNYGEILFSTSWYDHLSEEIKEHTIIDASRTSHYFWHLYTRMNWGEPWYAGFRESQTAYRLKNQSYFQRNLMPGMLGWFSLQTSTPIEDIEWMLARSAGFDAGYAFVAPKAKLEANGQASEILGAIGEWEKARMANVFSDEQKKRMQRIDTEFRLEPNGTNSWNLQQIVSLNFKHQAKVRQPGEPLFSSFEFESEKEEAMLHFILKAKDASISNIKMEINRIDELLIPVKLESGQSIRYYGGNKAGIYDIDLHKISDFELDASIFKIKKGSQTVQLDAEFANKKDTPELSLEIRIPGRKETVTAN